MAKFKVGDKVIAKNDTPYSITTDGWKGKVIVANDYNDMVRVEGKDRFGETNSWTVNSKYFDLDKSFDQKIVITTDGTTTTAKKYHGKTVVATATATCNPFDEFDFDAGAKIAFERLIKNPETTEEKPLLNTKICIVEGDKEFKTGQIYNIINGKIKQRDGFVVPTEHEFHSISEVESYFSPPNERKFFDGFGWSYKKIKFVEVIE